MIRQKYSALRAFIRGILSPAILLLSLSLAVAQTNVLRFAWLSDTHVDAGGSGAEDLRRSVDDINSQTNLGFVIVSGDVTQAGSGEQYRLAKSLLDGLHLPCHVIPGNHDCKWSDNGASLFPRVWGSTRFMFDAEGFRFIGLHQGPILKMGDGHFAPEDIRWLDAVLDKTSPEQPIIFVSHYPLDDSIDNWFAIVDRLKRFNTQAVLVGHGHANKKMNFEGLPGVMGRSNLRASQKVGGYTLVELKDGMITFTERNPGLPIKSPWHSIKLGKHDYAAMTKKWPRPDFSANTKYPQVKALWQQDLGWTIASTPAVAENSAIFGDGSGKVHAFSLRTGEPKWEFATEGPVYSTPAVSGDRVVFASTDGSIYALNATNGEKIWQFKTDKPIVASPCISSNVIFIGASDNKFRAIDLATGKLLWDFSGLHGFMETRPLAYQDKIIFGAWDENLYALDAKTGALDWKWNGGRPGQFYSPAACWPVAAAGKIFIVAPDRKMTVIQASSGKQVWRTGEYEVRESIGMAEDQSRFYVRSMNNSFAALATAPDEPKKIWEVNAHFGYDINSAMLVEKDGTLFYGTKNGLLFAMDSHTGDIKWEHKTGVSIINTVVPLSAHQVLLSDLDGKLTLLQEK